MNEIKAPLPSTIQLLPHPAYMPAGKIPHLIRGEILDAFILGQEGPDHFLLRINGEDFKVKTQVPLPPSGKISLAVEAIAPQIILKLLAMNETGWAAALSQLKKYLAETVPLQEIAEKLSTLRKIDIDPLPPTIQRTIQEVKALLSQYNLSFLTDPRTLQEKILQSGLFWENRLQQLVQNKGEEAFLQINRKDLKALLMELKSQFQGAGLTEGVDGKVLSKVENLVQGVDAYLQKIEAYQLLNQRYADPSEKWMLLLPLWVGQNLQFLELNLEFSPGDGGSLEKKDASLLFLLQLPEIGRIRIEVTVRQDALYCQLSLSDPSFKTWIQQNLVTLEKKLSALGFRPSFSIREEPLEGEKETIMHRMEENEENLISLII